MHKAPWTPEEVTSINHYQQSGIMHPFTCGSGSRCGKSHDEQGGLLIATIKGWVCPYCDYVQDWCHEFMANGTWREMQKAQRKWMEDAKLDIVTEAIKNTFYYNGTILMTPAGAMAEAAIKALEGFMA